MCVHIYLALNYGLHMTGVTDVCFKSQVPQRTGGEGSETENQSSCAGAVVLKETIFGSQAWDF